MKVLVIGLDGVGFDFIKPWLEDGKLPTIAKLMRCGAYGDLISTIPPYTPPAWVSYMTGKNPGKHGVYGFLKRREDSYGYTLVDSRDIGSECIWDILSNNNKKSIVINVPLTYPPWRINGIMVSGYPTPSTENYTYPKYIAKEIKDNLGEYIIFPDEKILNHPKMNKKMNKLLEIIEKRKEVALYLMNKYEYDFFMIEFQLTDTVCHMFRDRMKIFKVYQKVDGAISELLQNIDNQTNVLIMSDHGMTSVKKTLHLKKWLYDLGLYKTKKATQSDFVSHHISVKDKGMILLRELILKKLLYKLGLTAERIDHLLFTLKIDFIENKFPRLRQVMRQSLPRVSTDWSNTQVYLIPEYEFSGISINLKGREPQGVVEQKEYEKLRDHIIRELYNIKDPENNERIIENALKREEVYYGPYLDKAPDILVLTKNQKYQISLKLHKTVLTSFNGFDHSMNGIFIFFGPDVKRDVKIGGVKIFDLAPTILHILNTPVPRDMDGRVLKEVFREDSELATKEIVYQEVEEKEKIKQKVGELRSLKKV